MPRIFKNKIKKIKEIKEKEIKENKENKDNNSDIILKSPRKDTLPCESIVMCGYCPYGSKCEYIHDIRLFNYVDHHTIEQIKKIKKNKCIIHDKIKDVYFYDKDFNSYGNIKKKVYIPNSNENHFTRRLDVFKHLSNGKSIYDYQENDSQIININSHEDKSINYDYQKGYYLYKGLVTYISQNK